MMLVSDLKKRLDEIAWHEQVEHEMSERPAMASPPALDLIDSELRSLAASVDSVLLDELELESGYIVWVLRLAPYVEPALAMRRARPYLDSTIWEVRHWARAIA